MPKLDIDKFDEAPHVGDKIKVTGKVKSIDEDTGMVEVSYDEVKIVDEKKRKKRKDRDDDDFEDEIVFEETATDMNGSNSESLDAALARSFPPTQ